MPNKLNTAPQTLKSTTDSNEKIILSPCDDSKKSKSILAEKITLQDIVEIFGSLLGSIIQSF